MPASATSVIVLLSLDRPICVRCLSKRTANSEAAVERHLAVLATKLTLRRDAGPCVLCGRPRPTVSVADPMGRLSRTA